jgi:hypothetical protein
LTLAQNEKTKQVRNPIQATGLVIENYVARSRVQKLSCAREKKRPPTPSLSLSLSLSLSFPLSSSLCVSGGEKCCKKLELFYELVSSSFADLAGM